ncbi:MAG: type II secretion system F family protein [Cyanobacteria bacterium REEB67]|nr:type II secretion system F family protein [Cyanobacteria bacterium REEB67]
MKVDLLLAILSVPMAGGVAATWLWARRRERAVVAARLQKFMPLLPDADGSGDEIPHLISKNADRPKTWLTSLLSQAAMDDDQATFNFIAISALLLLLPFVIAFVFELNLVVAVGVGCLLALVPFVVVKSKAESRRVKFCEQLPDAIDLMVAVLRSGHSISQAVRAVSQEVPLPCGEEFEAILQRMNLGQPLSESLVLSARRFQSYELDLLRRAVAIQSEVGGSLAELLDKTNSTLRQRLKLVRQLRVITVQSRLSAQIVGFLPVVVGLGLNFISPGYLSILTNDKLGQMMLAAVVVLEIVGIAVMQRMSTMKV